MEHFVATAERVLEVIIFGAWRLIAWTVGGLCIGWYLACFAARPLGGLDHGTAVIIAFIGASFGFIGRLVIELIHLVRTEAN